MTGVQMASMCPVLALVTQSGSGAARLAGMDKRDPKKSRFS
jgi:hypothetical protein